MSFLTNLPDVEALLSKRFEKSGINVNGHIHTPYSFSSFQGINKIFQLAKDENVDVVGINDFYVTSGYAEFYKKSKEFNKFPLFNVEFIGLIPSFQEGGITVNDPNNPGRMYFSGKGLNFPLTLSDESKVFIENLLAESQNQMKEMAQKAEDLLKSIYPFLDLKYKDIKSKYAEELVRERHIAKAIRVIIEDRYPAAAERKLFYTQLFDGVPKSNINDQVAIENEIRGKLLKAGGAAFVPESPESFPSIDDIQDFILKAGGIPCYPVLLDDRKGNLITKFEGNWEKMDMYLKSMNVHALELIPSRNSIAKLREFVQFFSEKDYTISFGSEHNTPGLFPLEVKIDGEQVLPDDLKEVAYKGACVIAAHQYLHAKNLDGYVLENGDRTAYSVQQLEELGNAVIKTYLKK